MILEVILWELDELSGLPRSLSEIWALENELSICSYAESSSGTTSSQGLEDRIQVARVWYTDLSQSR